jgi:hypothetical protein
MSIWYYPHVYYWNIYCVLRCHCRSLHKGALNTFSVNHCTWLFISLLRILFWCNSWLVSKWLVGNEFAKENTWDLSGPSTKGFNFHLLFCHHQHPQRWTVFVKWRICKSFRITVIICLLFLKTRRLCQLYLSGYCCVPLDSRSLKLRI